ncbi:toll/interleukin-1 receptor domain-containing protein (plasmid) [Rhizobium leguminosarum]
MGRIFISHSSTDKAFVQRLAADLADAQLPVWFDSWEIELGDRVFERVFAGLDDSTYVILVLSPASVASSWVKREITSALEKEESLGRPILIPILLEPCVIPDEVRDRIYASTINGYRKCSEALIAFFQARDFSHVDPSDCLLVIRPKHGYHINSLKINKAIGAETHGGRLRKIEPQQLLIVEDQPYSALRDAFFAGLAKIKNVWLPHVLNPMRFSPRLPGRLIST